MHLGNGAITTECAMVGYGLAAVGLGAGLWLPRRVSRPSTAQITALGALVFAAQMINLPVGAHSSAHLVGGVLLANVLGPSIGMRVMAFVLVLQAMVLGDGGTLELGVNVFNMAILPALLVACGEKWFSQDVRAIGLTAAAAVLLAALMIPLEVAFGRSISDLQGWQGFLEAMIVYHLFAAALEAFATMVLCVVWKKLESWQASVAPTFAIASSLLLMFASPVISTAIPDGYEAAAGENMRQLLPAAEKI